MSELVSPAFTRLIDLASEKLGGKALACSDDFFAPKENLIKPGRGIFIPDKYTENGKWMDGWESRRRRTPGNDWCWVKLAVPGVIRGVDVDTNYFLGNHPPYGSIDACLSADDNLSQVTWTEILRKSSLNAGSQNFFEIKNSGPWSHIRLNIFPDGGVARLKVYGEVKRDWASTSPDELVDLAAAVNGGKAIQCNDMFFSHMDNINMPGRGINMGDGWETKRSRIPHNVDWLVLRLATKGTLKRVVVDTHHFKGNYPDRCMLEGSLAGADGSPGDWKTFLPPAKLEADREHLYENELIDHGPFTHIRLSIFPDGGVSRLRIWGNAVK